MLLRRPRIRPKFVCSKCGGTNVRNVKEDIFKCLDCLHTFRPPRDYGFNEKVFSNYDIKEYDNFMRTGYLKSFLNLNQNDVFLDVGWG